MFFFYFLIYNLLFLPLLFILVHLAAFFNRKVRQAVLGKYQLYCRLRRYRTVWMNRPVAVVHCASMGEFEHIKPFLNDFKKIKPDYAVLVLFFSPSGFQNVKSFPSVDLFLYAPFDSLFSIWRFIHTVRPRLWIIAKHDVWPNQVWLTRWFRIPVFLINASLHQQSSRLLWLFRPFHQTIYRSFTRILTISETDRNNFLKLVPDSLLRVTGDTKFDQVLYRKEESRKRKVLPHEKLQNRWVFVAGSTWPEDQHHLIPAIKSLHGRFPQFLTIICPHEPTDHHLKELRKEISPLEYVLLSEIERLEDQEVIIVDRIGVLANIYGVGHAAYVGGSFRQNVHNVLEPAAYGIPVLFGPVNQNSHEAQLLKASGGGIEVHQAEEIEAILEKFLLNDIYRQETGRKAFQIVEKHRGATHRTIQYILADLNETEEEGRP